MPGYEYLLRKWNNEKDAQAGINQLVQDGWIPHLMSGDINSIFVLFKREAKQV